MLRKLRYRDVEVDFDEVVEEAKAVKVFRGVTGQSDTHSRQYTFSRESIEKGIVANLNRQERIALILYYYENMTIKEIAVTLDVPEDEVNKIFTSSQSKLRQYLLDQE